MTNKTTTNRKYFHCYATANDSRLYLKDIKNLLRIRNCDSGISEIILFIAISEVQKLNLFDKLFVIIVKFLFYKHPSVKLMDVFFKTNVGRDFSSFQKLLHKVQTTATIEDFILFQNRSGYGPFREKWYERFVEQFEKFDSVALCGSTINFLDHPDRSSNNNLPHVQTYSFLSKIFFMNMLGHEFPGSNETIRLNVICKGEIGLSQFFLERNYAITCIEWSDLAITNQTKPPIAEDIKGNVTAKHYFYHREYFFK